MPDNFFFVFYFVFFFAAAKIRMMNIESETNLAIIND